jgi:branched-chain amino acid transport system substrate-binding protein
MYPGEVFGEMYRKGVEMAKEEINAKGGVQGRKIRIVSRNDDRSLGKSMLIAEEFAYDIDMVATIGHADSALSVSVAILYEFYGMLMMSPLSIAPQLTGKGMQLVFRNIPSADSFGKQLAEFSLKRKYQRVMIYYVNDTYGQAMANAYEKWAGVLGITVVDRAAYDMNSNNRNYRNVLKNWKEFYEFDAIFIVGIAPQAAEIVSMVRQVGIEVPIMGSDGLDSPEFLKVAGEAAEGTVVATPFSPLDPHPTCQEFVKAFKEKYQITPDGPAAQAYDALKVLAYAMEKAGSTVPAKVAKALHSTKDWQGVTGLTTFSEKGDVVNKSIDLEFVCNGRFEYLETCSVTAR